MTKDEWYRQLFERLGNSRFRSSFHLKQKDIDYINEKGLDTIRQHARVVTRIPPPSDALKPSQTITVKAKEPYTMLGIPKRVS